VRLAKEHAGKDSERELAPGARVVIESDRRAPLKLAWPAPPDERRYGDTLIEIVQLKI